MYFVQHLNAYCVKKEVGWYEPAAHIDCGDPKAYMPA